jgi:hypothetical protein
MTDEPPHLLLESLRTDQRVLAMTDADWDQLAIEEMRAQELVAVSLARNWNPASTDYGGAVNTNVLTHKIQFALASRNPSSSKHTRVNRGR